MTATFGWLFDAVGVLLLPSTDAIRQAVAETGCVPTDEDTRRAHHRAVADTDRCGSYDPLRSAAVFVDALGASSGAWPAAVGRVAAVYADRAVMPYGPCTDHLRDIAASGASIGIVSNATGVLARELAALGICSVDGSAGASVKAVVDSEVVGLHKPDPEIFRAAAAAIGLSPGACAVVGDSLHYDIRPALAAGCLALHLDPYDDCDDRAHPHVASLAPLELQAARSSRR